MVIFELDELVPRVSVAVCKVRKFGMLTFGKSVLLVSIPKDY